MSEKKTQGSGDQQPQDQRFVAPMSQDPAKAAAEAAAKAALEAALQAASHVQPAPPAEETATTPKRGAPRINTRKSTRRMRRNLQEAFVWLRSPGTLILGVAGMWLVEDNAKARKAKKRKGDIYRLRFARFDGDPFIHCWVTDPNDPNGYDLELLKGQFVVNISDWLFEEDMAPAPGISQKFDLVEANEPEFGGAVVCFNTEQARKVKYFDPSGGKDEEDGNDKDGEEKENE